MDDCYDYLKIARVRMQLHSISIRNFRRLKDVTIDFETKETVFVGPNNSGKTSATAAVRSFLGNRDFKIHDYSVCCISSIDAYHPEQEDNLPNIELDLWFHVDPESVAFGRVFALATSLSADFSEIGVRCSFAMDDAAELWKQYDSAFPVKEDGNRKCYLSHFLDLGGNLKKHFSVQISSLERDEDSLIATPIDPKEGKKILNSLLRVDFVDAQRNIDDENATRNNKLSEAFATYYRRNLEQAELAEEAVAVIEKNNENLTQHYGQRFEPLMTMIGGLGSRLNQVHHRMTAAISTAEWKFRSSLSYRVAMRR
jgi:putative ATP-dependent endonuclease of the OLD family